jgi:hypothetical protein
MMDHDVVVNNYTAERYLLGELTEAEREAYEEHYFGCADCAEEVLRGSEFVQIVREVGIAEPDDAQPDTGPVTGWRSNWFRPVAMAACALLAVGFGVNSYQNMTRNHGKGAQILSVSAVLNPDRSTEDGALPANKSLRLTFIVPPGNFKAYRSVIVGPSSVERLPLDITAEQAKSAVGMVINPGTLEPGKYEVVIRGVNEDGTLDKRSETRLPFRLEIQ